MTVDGPSATLLADYQSAPFHIDTVNLDIDLEATATRVTASLAVRRADSATRDLILDGTGLTLKAIAIDGAALDAGRYTLTDRTLTVHDVPDAFELTTEAQINPEANTSLEGLYMSGGMFCTQCEAEGYRKITWHLDRPDVLSVYTVRLTADRESFPVLLSNGNPTDGGETGDGRHWAAWHDPHPKPSYLFAIVAGDLAHIEDRFETRSGREVCLRIYTEHGNEDRCDFAMDALKRSMAWDETRFGLEYDLDVFNIVAVGDFNAGAMENKGLNIFNAALVLASPETATDLDYERIETVIAHEYFHNWTGNRITCRDWFQLCLKEGLTVFRDQEFSADMRDPTVKRIDDVSRLRAFQFPEDGSGLAHPVRPDRYIKIDNFYTATVYEKGAELVRMLQTMLGRDAFNEGMTHYIKGNDGTAATVEDFVASFAATSGRDLSDFMTWYEQSGTPQVTVRCDHDAEARTATLTLTQKTEPTADQPTKKPVPIPIRLGLLSSDGSPLPLHPAGQTAAPEDTSMVVELTAPSQSITFEDVAEKPVPSVLRHFSAPVRMDAGLSAAERLLLVSSDEDPFNRWEAAQDLARTEIRKAAEGATLGGTAQDLAQALGAALDDERLSEAFLARLIQPPSEDDVAQSMASVDPGAIFAAREAYRVLLAGALEDRLRARVDSHNRNAPFRADADQAGRRALANGAQTLLCALQKAADLTTAADLARGEGPMTDTLCGLSILIDSDHPDRETRLRGFHDQWQNNPLVLDKWFGLRARSAREDTLEVVRELTAHPKFTLRNPNRVRALIGGFVVSNPLRFHAPDGSGYRFFAEQILAIDALNPLFAARLLSQIKSWRKLEPQRRAQMEAALSQIQEARPVSDNVHEVVSRMLAPIPTR
ncbi:MAG: aminopeptidase N [Alphaproteobacteria bacterium]